MRLRSGAEHARRRIPSYGTALHPPRARAVRPRRSLELRQLRRHLSRRVARRRAAFCADADLFINLSGGSWFWRDEYATIPRKVFIDSDPVFTQLAIAKGEAVVRRLLPRLRSAVHLRRQHRHAGVRRPDRRLHLAQDLAAGRDRRCGAPTRRRARSLHTVMTWKIESFTDVGRQQGPGVRQVHRPAVAHAAAASSWRQRPAARCCASTAGTRWTRWACRGRCGTTATSSSDSKAEFGVAKHAYVANRSGWFSDRTECYLAAGRPALVQDTGWSAHLPHGHRAAAVLDAGGSDRRPRADRGRLGDARAARRRDRARALRRGAGAAALARGRRAAERPLRIAQVAPVAQPMPPPRSRARSRR